ncbi:MAG: serine/threonine-protein kinase [Usitatibacteraceae bacterium]
MQIDREIWLKVQPHLGTALSLDAHTRTTWLTEMDTREPALAPVLRRLVENHEKALHNAELETIPRLAPPPPSVSPFSAGQVIGPFRLVELLGRGGMGEVWRAAQTGGHVEREIALKLPVNVVNGTLTAARFLRERSILASLSHPNIARLIDAGISRVEGGAEQPWMAMDLVTGEPLLQYLSGRTSNAERRIRLFRQILAAVAHAHQHLVVHRDLKPANILVDADGTVKLLDFGIAKLIDEASPANQTELTQVGGRALTLRYAAPEQVAGGPISTATDVWALGLILYELLTGQPAFRAVREGRPFTESVITTEDIQPPSTLKPGSALENMPAGVSRDALSGDLDAIILKALRQIPAQRYASVEAFDADLAAYLERRPVSAREGNRRYLLGRYFVRHRVLIGASAAVVIALTVGLGVAETQRRQVVAEKARAEKHFANVRALANSFVFDVHSEIENLSGSLKARQVLVGTALKYLDSLSRESSTDPQLALEIVGAYRKLAEIKGDVYASYSGETGSAKQNVERARAILEPLALREPENIRVLREQRALALLSARLGTTAGDDGLPETEKAVRIAEGIVRLSGAEFADRRNLGETLAEYGWSLAVVKSDRSAASVQLKRAIEVLETLIRDQPGDLLARASLARAYARASIGVELNGEYADLPRAIELTEKSIATLEALVRDEPGNKSHLLSLVKGYSNQAESMQGYGDGKGASANIEKAREEGRRLLNAEPSNAAYALAYIRVLAVSSKVEYGHGRYERAVEYAREALAVQSGMSAEAREGAQVRANVAAARSQIGRARYELARSATLPSSRRLEYLKEARAQYVLSRAFRQELVTRKIDAKTAAQAVEEIGAEINRCDEMIASLGGSAATPVRR